MITTVPDADALVDLLYELNDRGILPSCAVLPADEHAEPILFYALDLGDTLGFEWYRDPGEDAAWCEASDNHKVLPLHSVDELPPGPYTVLHQIDGPWSEILANLNADAVVMDGKTDVYQLATGDGPHEWHTMTDIGIMQFTDEQLLTEAPGPLSVLYAPTLAKL